MILLQHQGLTKEEVSMDRKLFMVTIIMLLLSLAFASVSFAQTGTGDQQNQAQTQNQDQNQGGDPGSAFNSPGQGSRNLNAGQRHWYVFRYAGGNSPIQIRVGGSNMMFSVWTQQDIQNARGDFGATANPVGRSSANEQFGGDQYWTGSFNVPGNYFVMVEPMGQNTGSYTVSITGSGVSWQGQQSNQGQAAVQQGQGQTEAQQGQSGQQAGGVAPETLPTTGAATASLMPLLIGGMGALSVAAGALLRRKK
jgi:LPXTG-motif cell wall-anchored protein